MDSNKIYIVKNRSDGMVVYSIPEKNIRREFSPGESKKISFEELEKLSFQSGGRALMQDYLQILDQEVTDELGIRTEPEYFLDEQGVKTLLLTGSLDEFLDALDFAPDGVIDLIKKYAVELPLGDYQKRKALKEKTGFDVDKAIQHMEEERKALQGDITVEQEPHRRVSKIESAQPQRRTVPNKYNVVNK